MAWSSESRPLVPSWDRVHPVNPVPWTGFTAIVADNKMFLGLFSHFLKMEIKKGRLYGL